MLEKYPNRQTANYVLDQFKSYYQFKYHDIQHLVDINNDIGNTVYEANSIDDEWRFSLNFKSLSKSKTPQKQYQATLSFTDLDFKSIGRSKLYRFCEIMSEKLKEKYNPDFNQPLQVIKWFIESGMTSSLIIKTDELCYTPEINSHLTLDSGRSKTVSFTEKKVMMVHHNKIIQQGKGYQNAYYKKSLLKIEIVFLVHSDESLQPYFKITLPYMADKKVTCLMSFENTNAVYLFEKDSEWKNKCIDTLAGIDNNENDIKNYFTHRFFKEMKQSISKKLHINKKDLEALKIEELKAYYPLIEMVEF
jgi:hypothetical protein